MLEKRKNLKRIGSNHHLAQILSFFLICASIFPASAQSTGYSVELSADTVQLGENFQLNIRSKNIEGEFKIPDLSPFQIVGGPNSSTSISITNGEVERSASTKYTLRAKKPGSYSIGPSYIIGNKDSTFIPPLELVVIESDGHSRNGSRINASPKRNRKVYKL